MNIKEYDSILEKMCLIQKRYNDNVEAFQKDKEFILLAGLIQNKKFKKIRFKNRSVKNKNEV